MTKLIICIGGGELKSKETLRIDGYIADLAKKHAGEKRAYGLFIPTASHDSMPYFNSFRKTYTSVFDIKADVALTVYGEMDMSKIREKFQKADFIYVGGGDTVFMLEHWKKTGLLDLILDAYERGVILCGLSAGAICWFETMYTDSESIVSETGYALYPGLNLIKGIISPHYDLRMLDFDKIIAYNRTSAIGLENNSAVLIEDGKIVCSMNGGGNAYRLQADGTEVRKEIVQPCVML